MLRSEQQQFYFKIKSVWFLNVLRRELREIFWLQITSLIKSHLLIQLTTVYTGLYFIAEEMKFTRMMRWEEQQRRHQTRRNHNNDSQGAEIDKKYIILCRNFSFSWCRWINRYQAFLSSAQSFSWIPYLMINSNPEKGLQYKCKNIKRKKRKEGSVKNNWFKGWRQCWWFVRQKGK